MADLTHSSWSEIDANNTQPSPDGIQGGYSPSTVAPILRGMRGAMKRFFDHANAIYTTTGTGNAYVLTYEQGPTAYTKGVIIRFYASFTNTGTATLNINGLGAKTLQVKGVALTASQIGLGDLVEVAYDGTNFQVLSDVITDKRFIGTTYLSYLELAPQGGVEGGEIKFRKAEGQTALTGDGILDLQSQSFRMYDQGNTSRLFEFDLVNGDIKFNASSRYWWHNQNDGAGSGLDSDLLDGQQGSFYQNATNLNAGTIADARLPGTMANKTFTGTLTLPGITTNTFTSGTGDGASYTTYNTLLRGWWGMGMSTYDNTVNGYYDFRQGKWDTKGGFFKNGTEAYYSNGGTLNGNITMAAGAERWLQFASAGNMYLFGNGNSGGTVGLWAPSLGNSPWQVSQSTNTMTFGSGFNNFSGTVNVTGPLNGSSALSVPSATIAGINVFRDDGSIPYGYESIKMASTQNLRIYFGTSQRYIFESGGNVTLNTGGLYAQTELGIGGARVYNDGNVYGGAWGGYLSNWINGNFAKINGVTQNLSINGSAGTLFNANNPNSQRMVFNWNGQGGQPNWLFGGNDGTNMYVYNPSNFSVNYANTANYANNAGSLGGVGATSFSQFYGGDDANYTNFPLGSYLFAQHSGSPTRNGAHNVYVNTGDNLRYNVSSGSICAGVWRAKGFEDQSGARAVLTIRTS